jgi:hypothetical protein
VTKHSGPESRYVLFHLQIPAAGCRDGGNAGPYDIADILLPSCLLRKELQLSVACRKLLPYQRFNAFIPLGVSCVPA